MKPGDPEKFTLAATEAIDPLSIVGKGGLYGIAANSLIFWAIAIGKTNQSSLFFDPVAQF
jgi:hypothetical protein